MLVFQLTLRGGIFKREEKNIILTNEYNNKRIK
jgi:hypothetical protein